MAGDQEGAKASVGPIAGDGRGCRQIEDEGGTLPRAVTVDGQRAVHFFRGARAGVDPKPMPGGASREAMVENLDEILGGDADAVCPGR